MKENKKKTDFNRFNLCRCKTSLLPQTGSETRGPNKDQPAPDTSLTLALQDWKAAGVQEQDFESSQNLVLSFADDVVLLNCLKWGIMYFI